ncbi:ribose 5-phosphate isomerase B [Candidatus Endolissoclinum faulkneri L5]|uniref:Ribose 5-phosphate isomerase B n=1 Tax=Candidatus Endolissoclinum faulkneri L5 TaxID=1401328 RepID=V9TT01_9PROT|nr:ribose 5-phosphate isomerase B [Candidatus Endolissoclinum faulkneri]AHC73696.1 ribose 5-phosphate isomerase B [Candidatus Endolissoclinum faulkneri L5]
MSSATIAIASDHAGFPLKSDLANFLRRKEFEVLDLGINGTTSVDYPDFAVAVAQALLDGKASRGVLVCGTGLGISIAANRYPWVRAALCHDVTTARLCREHNDANVIALGARLLGIEVARDCLEAFLTTYFCDHRHTKRLVKMTNPPNLNNVKEQL